MVEVKRVSTSCWQQCDFRSFMARHRWLRTKLADLAKLHSEMNRREVEPAAAAP
jgi:hypothetical protein